MPVVLKKTPPEPVYVTVSKNKPIFAMLTDYSVEKVVPGYTQLKLEFAVVYEEDTSWSDLSSTLNYRLVPCP